jgi:hypothetical protein
VQGRPKALGQGEEPDPAGCGGEPATKRNTYWGREPVGGWTEAQTRGWEQEEAAREATDAAMETRVLKAVKDFQRNPEEVSKKTETAIKQMGA